MEMEEEKEMKTKFLTMLTAVSLFACTPAFAETVDDHYKTITKRVPYTENVCNWVDVPIYGQTGGGASAGDVLGGMIIGGLIGKGVTNKDNGAAAGAVIGGMIAADKNQGKETIIGYRQERQCKDYTRYDEVSEQVYSHSTVTFYSDGKKYVLRFKK
jgi:uncharacterized protein YcfJ